MSLRVTLVQGGGIGYDLVPAVKHILEKAGVAIAWDEHLAGGEAMARGQDLCGKRQFIQDRRYRSGNPDCGKDFYNRGYSHVHRSESDRREHLYH